MRVGNRRRGQQRARTGMYAARREIASRVPTFAYRAAEINHHHAISDVMDDREISG